MIDLKTYKPIKVVREYDPTHTLSLRNAFARDMRKRFTELARVVKIAIVDKDCFGLARPNFLINQMTPTNPEQFMFERSERKLVLFMEWLEEQVKKGIIDVRTLQQIGSGIESSWTNLYVYDSYKRGIMRARTELKKAGYDVPSIDQSGGIFSSLNNPFHIDRLGLIYTRVYTDLKGVTEAMDASISRILAQGLADGDNPMLLARKIAGTIDEIGIRRAELIARTEVIRAHHQATIQEYMNWRAEGVYIQAEVMTAGDKRVCSRCMAVAKGSPYTLEEAMNLIPIHPNCFIDPQIPIYTSKGWKQIGDVKIGDFVLTHKKRFRKVYALPRTYKQYPIVVKFKFKGQSHLSLTENHQVLIFDKKNNTYIWKEARECTINDKILFLANHLDQYLLVPWEIEKITTFTKQRACTLYNLSVEEDESYIAKGVVVHNCRCCAIPFMGTFINLLN